jgi:N utilization substance protein B
MSRRKAREMALQALFQMDFNDNEPTDALEAVFDEAGSHSGKTKSYAQDLVSGTQEHLSEIDKIIVGLASEWKLDRMAGVDRNIARMAIYEMNFGSEQLTPNVVINEAVELAKRFGTDDSSRFINGILGSIVKKRKFES